MADLLFAVTREDPQVEESLIRDRRPILTIASGGCTALHLKSVKPNLGIVAFDINPTQLEHVEDKIKAVENGEWNNLNIGDSSVSQINQRGEFEGLFRLMRSAWIEFICSEDELLQYFLAQESYENH